ncbi:MAG TPA: S8 family serine peptidase, partial [Chitinophagaceae bacterium]
MQFRALPGKEDERLLSKFGIRLVDYIPNNAYTVLIQKPLNAETLKQLRVRSVIELPSSQKMSPALAAGTPPAWAVKLPGTADVWVTIPRSNSMTDAITELKKLNFDVINDGLKQYHIIGLRVPLNRLNELAALTFVSYVQPAPHEDQPLNNVGRNNTRANVLNNPVIFGGRNLHGEGVVVGIGDDSDPQLHVDFSGRLITRTYAPPSAQHGMHVAGTMGGAGIINELYKGYAPKMTIISQYFSGIWQNAPGYVQDYGMVLTNNSYGAITGDCSYNGLYDLYSSVMDQQAFDLPYLQQVFAAGNSGADVCSPYPAGFATVLGSYQSAKNVLTVGNTDSSGVIAGGSSTGPVKDGRIKPEITDMGRQVMSTGFGSYYLNNGTSMSCPGVTGGLALLYQLYRQLNAGANPKNALMKAVVCNSGRDLGNAGPDYTYGFGWLDLKRAAMTLENTHYFNASLANAGQNTHVISVPANTAQLKVLLYWNDPPASMLTSRTLVNDLDLSVQTPSSTTILPKILDTLPTHITNPCTEGADHINNIEQVVINAPAAGSYNIKVNGTSVTQLSPQEYFVVYDFVPDSTTLTFPIGGEAFGTPDSALIQWDAFGTGSTFTVDYSTDDGASWTQINNAIPASLRQLKWNIPAVPTDRAKVRLTNNVSGTVSSSARFTILGQPVIKLADTVCEGYIKINWNVVPSATDYEVFMLRGDDMQAVGTTTDTTFTFAGLSRDSVYWVAVRGRLNGAPGRRSIALSRQPNTGTCLGNISDHDLKLDTIFNSSSGRKFTSTALGNAVQLQVRVKNLDDAPAASYNVSYSLNGGPWVTENVVVPLNGGDTLSHFFSTPVDLSAVGTYTIRAVVDNTGDTVHGNDTLTSVIRQLDNQPLNLATPFLENFDAVPAEEYRDALIGLGSL